MRNGDEWIIRGIVHVDHVAPVAEAVQVGLLDDIASRQNGAFCRFGWRAVEGFVVKATSLCVHRQRVGLLAGRVPYHRG